MLLLIILAILLAVIGIALGGLHTLLGLILCVLAIATFLYALAGASRR